MIAYLYRAKGLDGLDEDLYIPLDVHVCTDSELEDFYEPNSRAKSRLKNMKN